MLNRAFIWIRLQFHVAASLARPGRPGFDALETLASRPPGRRLAEQDTAVRWCGLWLSALARLGWKPACLRRSMIFARVLRLEGYDALVVLGARKSGPEIEGHSWVEVEGARIGLPGEEYEGYQPLWRGGEERGGEERGGEEMSQRERGGEEK